MKYRDIHVGDVLRIRRWEDMEAEFGLGDDGEINCSFKFTKNMLPVCGQKFTVMKRDSRERFWSEEGVEKINLPTWRDHWNISADMLEPWCEEEIVEPVSEDSLFDFLMGTKEET